MQVKWATVHPDFQKGANMYSDLAILELFNEVIYPTPIVGSVCLLKSKQNQEVTYCFHLHDVL